MICSTKVLCPQNLFLRKSQSYKSRVSHYVDMQRVVLTLARTVTVIDKITVLSMMYTKQTFRRITGNKSSVLHVVKK